MILYMIHAILRSISFLIKKELFPNKQIMGWMTAKTYTSNNDCEIITVFPFKQKIKMFPAHLRGPLN